MRLILDDDKLQGKAASKLLAGNMLFVPLTVVMETEWVLRAAYGLPRSQIADAIGFAINIENLHFEVAEDVCWAVDRYRDGADFSDMIHIIASKELAAFATFDRKLEKQALPNCPLIIQTIC